LVVCQLRHEHHIAFVFCCGGAAKELYLMSRLVDTNTTLVNRHFYLV
jgi:hypothetical protein